jgi:hypothetical protein
MEKDSAAWKAEHGTVKRTGADAEHEKLEKEHDALGADDGPALCRSPTVSPPLFGGARPGRAADRRAVNAPAICTSASRCPRLTL